MDFFNKAMEQAKQLQQIAADATQKGIEQATPVIQQGLAKAQELQQTIVEQTPNWTAAAKDQADAALQHTNAFIDSSKTVLAAGATQAQAHLGVFADQAKKAADATISAVQSAAQKQTPPSPPTPPTPPTPET